VPTDRGSPTAVARALVAGALALGRGEHLVVVSWNHTLPWASAAVAEARRVGARPLLLLEDEAAFWRSLDTAPSSRGWTGPSAPLRAALAEADALLYFPGPADRPRFHALPAHLQAPFAGTDDDWYRRVRAAGIRGVRCLLGYASDDQAELWGVPGPVWRNQLIHGIVEADYRELKRDGSRVSRLLAAGRELRLQAGNGTDLRLRLKGRVPWPDDGQVDAEDRRTGRAVATAPAGSVVVAVDERGTSGTVVANRPSFLGSGRAEGGQWEVEGGRLRNYWYQDGGEAFESEFSQAPRGRETVGLVALGLNPALDRAVPQAEDLASGTVTVAIGGNTLYGGRNRCRFLSWVTVGEATVAVDGRPLVDRGKIL
jgi:leucyl aminopeptidase (aminopeptidase T)